MFRGSLEQTAQIAPREKIVNAALARDDGGGYPRRRICFLRARRFGGFWIK